MGWLKSDDFIHFFEEGLKREKDQVTYVGVHLDLDLFIREAFLSKTKCGVSCPSMQHVEECFLCFMLTCVSFPSACDCSTGAGLVLTGSWWGVMRDANSHNLSLEADQLVTSKCIQRVLSLQLPCFEAALFHLWVSVRDREFISSSTSLQRPGENGETRVCVCVLTVCLLVLCVHCSLYFCVSTRGWRRESWRRECQSILALEDWRSSFHVLPASSQAAPNQSGA